MQAKNFSRAEEAINILNGLDWRHSKYDGVIVMGDFAQNDDTVTSIRLLKGRPITLGVMVVKLLKKLPQDIVVGIVEQVNKEILGR